MFEFVPVEAKFKFRDTLISQFWCFEARHENEYVHEGSQRKFNAIDHSRDSPRNLLLPERLPALRIAPSGRGESTFMVAVTKCGPRRIQRNKIQLTDMAMIKRWSAAALATD